MQNVKPEPEELKMTATEADNPAANKAREGEETASPGKVFRETPAGSTGGANADLKEKIFRYTAMALLIGSFIYFTVYGFLSDPFQPSGTASEIGLKYPTAFKFWGFTTSLALTVNLVYTYTRKDFRYRGVQIAGYVCMALGVACLMTCVHIPSTREPGLQMYAHWSTALLFALFFAAAIILHLLFPAVPNKKYRIALYCFAGLLAAIVIALLIWGKNGFIESLPMWMAYIIVFLDNFTPALEEKR